MSAFYKNTPFFKKAYLKKKTPAASLKRRKHGLGLPIHIKYQPILLNIGYYVILVLNRLLYINYIEFPSRIRDFPSRMHPGRNLYSGKCFLYSLCLQSWNLLCCLCRAETLYPGNIRILLGKIRIILGNSI